MRFRAASRWRIPSTRSAAAWPDPSPAADGGPDDGRSVPDGPIARLGRRSILRPARAPRGTRTGRSRRRVDDHVGPGFERPVDRAAEFVGAPGAVRFLELPARHFVMIDGEGQPGSGSFAPRMPGLYATAYKLHFILKDRGVTIRIGPLEGLWWTAEDYISAIGRPDRDLWNWTLLIALPDDATDAEMETALETGRAKLDPSLARGLRIERFRRGPRRADPPCRSLRRGTDDDRSSSPGRGRSRARPPWPPP